MNLGIITITQGTNFGNRLQVYAVQKVLKSMGHTPYLILNNTGVNGLLHRIKHTVSIVINRNGAKDIYRRQKVFDKFDMKYIEIWKETVDENYTKSNIADNFDALICGSDQVWNPQIPYLSGICFADFPGDAKRISYAASFGVDVIPDNKVLKYREWLSKFSAISVREEKGKEIIHSLAGKEATVLIDPTMMLDSDDWSEIEERPQFDVPDEYILVYYLGKKCDELNEMIDEMKEKYGIVTVDITPILGSKFYCSNPSNFIYLLHHSRIVITDSYHASVFSILFNKPFRVFDRVDSHASMTSRIDTLANYFNIEKQRNNYQIEIDEQASYFDNQQLELLRKKTRKFLVNALNEG